MMNDGDYMLRTEILYHCLCSVRMASCQTFVLRYQRFKPLGTACSDCESGYAADSRSGFYLEMEMEIYEIVVLPAVLHNTLEHSIPR
jgi:hypothetical protein